MKQLFKFKGSNKTKPNPFTFFQRIKWWNEVRTYKT